MAGPRMRIVASNRKRQSDFGAVYSMERIVGPVCLRMDVAVCSAELVQGRSMVAHRLHRARRELRQAVAKLAGRPA